MWFYGIMVYKKVNSDRASKRHFESTFFFSFGDKSRFFMTEDCNSNNTLLTPGVTTKPLHYNYYKHDNREKLNQKDIIIQFTIACFTALCTLKSNLHLSELWFSRCRASYKKLLFLDH